MKATTPRWLAPWLIGTVALAVFLTLRFKLYLLCQSCAAIAIKGVASLIISFALSIVATAMFLIVAQVKTRASVRNYLFKQQKIV